MTRLDACEHLPWSARQELRRVAAMIFEAFAETIKGRQSERYRSGQILKLILYGPHVRTDGVGAGAGEAFHLAVIVNHPKLARRTSDWHAVRNRMRRAWELGEIVHPVRLAVHSLQQVNDALAGGVPHFVDLATEGVELYTLDGAQLAMPRRLPELERCARGLAQFRHWHGRAGDFLLGAAFYRSQGNAAMAALLVHQACEHLYQCVISTLRLHGPRTHALDELRELAEALDARLRSAWPRETPFERRAFGCIRRAYVEARYEANYRISDDELAWAMGQTTALHALVVETCKEAIEDPPIRSTREPERRAHNA